MATKYLEPGGDATFNTGLWPFIAVAPAIATDFVHGTHVKSIRLRPSTADQVGHQGSIIADAGGRVSFWIYLAALPAVSPDVPIIFNNSTDATTILGVNLTTGGALQFVDNANVQIGTNGATLATGTWYRICIAWTITSTTVNQLRLFVNGALSITVTNGTLSGTGMARFYIGNTATDTALDFRISDFYCDDSTSLADVGNIWVTAKRPNANGTTNGYTTQIGAGGSGYGTGHSPQVNERPQSDTNGWAITTVASAITEEYNIESVSQGDTNITGATIVDYMGWLRSKALTNETAQIIVNNVNSNISLTSSIAYFTKIAGSATYPAGTGTDIGEISAAIATTISLYEIGMIVAYIPAVATTTPRLRSLLGVGL